MEQQKGSKIKIETDSSGKKSFILDGRRLQSGDLIERRIKNGWITERFEWNPHSGENPVVYDRFDVDDPTLPRHPLDFEKHVYRWSKRNL